MSKDLSPQQIDEVVAENMYRTEFLQALMQESPFAQEHIKIIPVGFDVTEHEEHFRHSHYDDVKKGKWSKLKF